MAKKVFVDAFVSVAGVDLSDHVKSVTLDLSVENQDNSAMGANTRTNLGGLLAWKVTINFLQNFDASKVDATLWPLVAPNTTATLIIREDNTSGVSATNPNYTGLACLADYTPIGGEVGAMSMAPVTFNAAGALSRATS